MDTGKVSDRFGHFPEYRGVTGTPGGLMSLMGLSGREEEAAKVGACPPSPIRIGRGAGPPFLLQLGKGGILLPVGVGLLLARICPGRPHPPCSFIYRGRGAP